LNREDAKLKCVFIGKPCDVAALRKLQAANPDLKENVSLAIGIFCAGTPSTAGTYKVLESLGVKSEMVAEFRYRGCGWPGETVVKVKGDDNKHRMTYEQSWGGILSKHVQFRCRFCPDSTGEFADISCGDPWYRKIESGDAGRSIVLVRTERGRDILHKAIDGGYVKLERVPPTVLPASQQLLLKKRQMIFGRFAAMHMMLIPTPEFDGFPLLSNWKQLSVLDKCRSIFGTIRRAICRGWFKPAKPLIAKQERDKQISN
jgi:coenzyme F420 hydrogenase subunit beta